MIDLPHWKSNQKPVNVLFYPNKNQSNHRKHGNLYLCQWKWIVNHVNVKYIAYSVFRCMWLFFFCWNYASRLNCIVNIRTKAILNLWWAEKWAAHLFMAPRQVCETFLINICHHLPTSFWLTINCHHLTYYEYFDHQLDSHITLIWPFFSPQMLTLFYLDNLVSCLRDIGYNHLTLPILAFEDLLSRDLLKSEPLNVLVHFK